MNYRFGQIIYKMLSKSGRYKRSRFAPERHHKNVFLVEYPKSGITYLSVLLANYWSSKNVNFFNVDRYVSDVHVHPRLLAPRLDQTDIRLIKSHAEPGASYHYVIHLVREPIDALVSYYNYLRSYDVLLKGSVTFSQFIRSHRGVARWVGHTQAWLETPIRKRYLPVTYSNVVQHPEHFVQILTALHGEEFNKTALDKAIRLSSRHAMIKQEKLWNNGGRVQTGEGPTTFTGKKNFIKTQVTAKDIAFIEKETRKLYAEIASAEQSVFGFQTLTNA